MNSGTIDANQFAGLNITTSGGTTNTGKLEATGGSTLTLGGTFTNTGGTISATGSELQLTGATVSGGAVTLTGASLLQMTNSTIHGGSTLTNSTTGTIEVVGGSNTIGGTLSNPAGGLLKVDNGAVLNLENGSYLTSGAMQLNAAGSTTELVVAGANVTLGGGTLTLSNNTNNYIFGATSADTLTNQETIQGAGHIGNNQMTLVNSGTIDANQFAGMIIQPSGGFTNNGTLLVGSGIFMHVSGGPFSNFSGTTLTGGTYNTGGLLEIDQLGTAGGEIVTNAANIVLNGANSSIVDAFGLDALSKLAVTSAGGSFSLLGGRSFTTAGNYTNNGTLSVGTGSIFSVHSVFTNFSGTTLTGGTYNVTGAFQFAGANIVTNSANITLTGTTSKILNSTTSADGLANFATNSSTGSFSLAGARNFTTAGNFSNAGNFLIGAGSAFTVGGPGAFTQTAGTTTDNGTLSATGGVSLGGSLIGTGSVTGGLTSNGNITPGTSTTKTGILTDTGLYTQNSAGVLNISIGGTTAGSTFDVLNSSTAKLGGTLNVREVNGFVPTIGSAFKILNFTSETGQFATVNGLSINGTEHFTITYEGTDVLLTVVSGAAAPANVTGNFRNTDRIARAIDTPVDFADRTRSSARSGFHLEQASHPTGAPTPIGTSLHDALAGRWTSANPSHLISTKQSVSALPHSYVDGRGRLGAKVARGNLQFALPGFNSRPQLYFSVN
ncbi:MAG TPA: hypothetical protein VNZ06_03270 [Steroidobacteraceae bacterium]|nr:hypothetical protein [Steroidobacteraceae bacterium]